MAARVDRGEIQNGPDDDDDREQADVGPHGVVIGERAATVDAQRLRTVVIR